MFIADGFLAEKKKLSLTAPHIGGGRFDILEHFKDTEQNVHITNTALTEHSCFQRMPGPDAITRCGLHF